MGSPYPETTYPKVVGKGILAIAGPHPIFENGLMLYLVEIAPLKVASDVEVILADKGTPIMALAHVGKGQVFALNRTTLASTVTFSPIKPRSA